MSGKGDRTFLALHDCRPTCTRLIVAAHSGYTDGSFGNFSQPYTQARAASGNPIQARAASGNPRQAWAASGNPRQAWVASSNPRQARAASGNPRLLFTSAVNI